MMRRTGYGFVCLLLTFTVIFTASDQAQTTNWPLHGAPKAIVLYKCALEDPLTCVGLEPDDEFWLHLHQGQPGAENVTVQVRCRLGGPNGLASPTPWEPGTQIKY